MKSKHDWTKEQAKSAQVPNFGKKYISEPELLRMVGPDIAGKKILELGSGNGYWLELLTKHGADCTGIEIATEQLELAKASNPNISYIQGDITTLNMHDLKEESYDTVLVEHVLLEIPSTKEIASIMKESYRLLKKSGTIIVSDLHPFAASLKPDNIRTPAEYNYFSSGEIIEVVSKRLDGGETIYRDFHWTLSDIVGSLTQAGFQIVELTEPRPSKELVEQRPDIAYRETTPMAFWIKAIKP